ncbi:Sugar kinase of the NBD/HSP70 family, may contain an N-terminal HTH domain [Cellulosimicrobium aquatile]|uniref:ROK family protein n=2 Tax=Cellulosimicrobium TaxID=157920 RepID=A0A4Y8R1H7_9MICO|nr:MULTISPECIES: ROK family protein [Cellulosimicrobium]TGA72840.1 ROK family protein [Cellulosimicrobium terreum]UTT58251.1 ROK family transcriptional regulator [Cellulosimicrobium cellulans]MCM3534165.1 ROK family transcriptional regulator [Cellulosimicrobium funkei]NMF30092.1 ROK family transcriptional regulator [Cellulosimicrobium aquatile]TFF08448.1 ROK family protein [Cellulosimicrobium funkei]
MEELLKFAPRPTGAGDMFQLLRDGQPRTRADLAAITGQARSTIAARIDLLMSAGLIAPAGEASSTGGRPPVTFAFSPEARIVLAVDLGATHARLAVTDLASNVLAETDAALAIADGPDVVLSWVADTGEKLVATTGRSIDDLVSVGVGLPGPVEHSSGRPINPPIMPAWDDVDVPGILQKRFDASVLVDNDVNIMALGEHRTAWPAVTDMLFVKVATGIGSGIIADGELRRGAQGAAGDIGHVAVPSAADVPCRCGNVGCLEAVASGQAVAAALAAAGLDATTSSDVVALVRGGDLAASQAVRQAGRDIGSVLAACVSLLNPSLIVIGGIVAEAGEHLIAGIREIVYQRSLPLATQHLRIVTSQARGQAGVLGASAMAVDHVLSPAAIDALIA